MYLKERCVCVVCVFTRLQACWVIYPVIVPSAEVKWNDACVLSVNDKTGIVKLHFNCNLFVCVSVCIRSRSFCSFRSRLHWHCLHHPPLPPVPPPPRLPPLPPHSLFLGFSPGIRRAGVDKTLTDNTTQDHKMAYISFMKPNWLTRTLTYCILL